MTEPQNGPPEVPLWGPAPPMPGQSIPEPTQRPMFDIPTSPSSPPPEPPGQPPVRHSDSADHRGRTTTWLVACGAAVVIVLVLVVVVVTRRPNTSTGSAVAAQTGSPIGQVTETEPPSTVPTTVTSTSAAPTTTTDTPTTTARILAGPYGMQVSAPPDWTTKPGTVPSVTEVDNPAVPGQFIRFGAAPPVSSGTLLDTVLQYEQTTPGIGSGYQRVQLAGVSFGSAPEAVEWEFTFGTDQGTRHACGLYWRINGIEYVLYASSYEADWATTQQAFQAMQATAGPS